MFSISSRGNAMLGLFVGAAKAESVAWNFPRLTTWRKIKLLRDRHGACHINKLQFYGADTQLLLASAQATLNSGSTMTDFRKSFVRRLRYLPLGLPSGLSIPMRWSSLKSWLSPLGVTSGCRTKENSCLLRALVISLAFHGTGHSLQTCISKSTRLTHEHSAALESCQAMATLVQLAARSRPSEFRAVEAARAMSVAWTATNRANHELICDALDHRRSPRAVASSLGWGAHCDVVVTAQLAAYCFLRYPTDYWRATNSALALSGDSVTLSALVGGLVGAHLGFDELPQRARDARFLSPHGVEWMKELSNRLSIWPHGVEDLNIAPALNSWPLMQLMRNTLILGVRFFRGLWRLPLRLIGC
jgi:ADP-ribosyl-[dinitrogen reductase] hydrolase